MGQQLTLLLVSSALFPLVTAAAEPEKFEPELDAVWDSTYGQIHWDEGWYGTEDHTIAITGNRWDPDRRAYVVIGSWGRVKSKTYKGTFEFTFTSPVKFEGWWVQDGHDTRNGWNGSLERKVEARDPDPALRKPVPLKPRDLKGPEEADFVPDLKKVWESTYGDVHWLKGYYGGEEKTLDVTEHGWDPKSRKFVVRGLWGRLSDPGSHGPFEFEFSNPSSFAGWWSSTGSSTRYGWSGKLEEQ